LIENVSAQPVTTGTSGVKKVSRINRQIILSQFFLLAAAAWMLANSRPLRLSPPLPRPITRPQYMRVLALVANKPGILGR